MVTIRPFKALRPKEDLVHKVNSPPYDVISRDEARMVINNNPYSFLQVVKPEATVIPERYLSSFRLAEVAAKNLKKLIREKIFLRDEVDSFYLYGQSNDICQRTGLVACLSVEDYQSGVIKRHEHIDLEVSQERAYHIIVTKAHTGCVLVVYKNNPHIEELLQQVITSEEQIYHFKSDDGVVNTCWRIKEKKVIDSLITTFRQVAFLYIADGHHRAAAAVQAAQFWKTKLKKDEQKEEYAGEEYSYFPALLVPHDQIRILPYHRIVRIFPGLVQEDFLEQLNRHFQVEIINSHIPFLPSQKHEFGMNLCGQWYRLLYKEDVNSRPDSDIIAQLDVTILQNQILKPLLGIGNLQQKNRIEFIGGKQALPQIEDRIRQGSVIVFTLFPISIEEVIKVGQQEQIMPPKSTWFEPKVRSGVFIHLFA